MPAARNRSRSRHTYEDGTALFCYSCSSTNLIMNGPDYMCLDCKAWAHNLLSPAQKWEDKTDDDTHARDTNDRETSNLKDTAQGSGLKNSKH